MNISLSEILLILIVALIVIKPEHLPDFARKLGQWFSAVRQSVLKIKNEFGKND